MSDFQKIVQPAITYKRLRSIRIFVNSAPENEKIVLTFRGERIIDFTSRFRVNDDDYTTYSLAVHDRFVETSRTEIPGRPWPKRSGFYRWQVGDFAAVHLNDPLPWTLVELCITEVIDNDSYRAVITKFDGQRQTITGLSLGDELAVKGACFFAVWGPGQTREDGEGAQKIYVEGSTKRLYRT